MVTSVGDQVTGHRSHGVDAELAALELRRQEEIDPRVAEVGLVLLGILDQAGQFSFD